MGSDDLFHRRRGTNKDSLQRRGASKSPAPLYLIICEGKKTEPQYFNELRNSERISSITVKVCGECDSAPISVVEYAVNLYEELKAEGSHIEKVYCVFDKDNHESYYKACAAIEGYAKKQIPIEAIKSIPCFEYWLVLHFEKCRSPYQGTGKGSIANQVSRHLRTYIKKYEKGVDGLYNFLKDKQEFALANAKAAQTDVEHTGEENPSTQVHILVGELLKYRSTW